MARSDNWRINRSSIMAVEGAQLLKALRKVAGAVGLPKEYTIKFMSEKVGANIDFTKKEVVVGAGRLLTEAPLPADKMDVLVGLTLHEVGHYMVDTHRVMVGISSMHRLLFREFCNIGEDVVVESYVRSNPNLADYDKALCNWATMPVREAKGNKLLELWIEYGLVHKVNYEKMDKLPQEMKDAMGQLVALTGWLRRVPFWPERCAAYLKYWEQLEELITNPPELVEPEMAKQDGGSRQEPKGSESGSESQYSDTPEDSDDKKNGEDGTGEQDSSGENGTKGETEKTDDGDKVDDNDSASSGSGESGQDMGETEAVDDTLDRPLAPNEDDAISGKLAKEIENALETEQEDVTDEVLEMLDKAWVGYNIHKQFPVIRSRETKTPLIKPDQLLRKKLERILTIRKRLQARTMHGERYGRIDKRHLHRVVTDQKVFSLRYKFPDGFPDTKILLDLSGSMCGREADEVLEAAGALQSVVNAEVWCYYKSNNGIVKLIRVDDGKLIHQCVSDGGTPSGLAILGVSVGMKNGGLIVHLTDGQHNVGQSPWLAHWALKKRGVNLVNLVWGNQYMTKYYDLDGMNVRRLHGLAEFPDALYGILVEQSKLGNLVKR
uniref:von Willebrand domain containing protein n=1 Tax=viral metagenome TaxID=1070528 RepID=A0A6M3KMN9_9ZZZZ